MISLLALAVASQDGAAAKAGKLGLQVDALHRTVADTASLGMDPVAASLRVLL